MAREKLLSVTKNDFVFKETKGSGSGGQARNKTSSAMRCTHPPSGAVGYSEASRSQVENKKVAFQKCVDSPEFQRWLKVETARATGELARIEAEIQRKVDRDMRRENLAVEVVESGQWVTAVD